MQTIEQRIIKIVAEELGILESGIKPESHIENDLDADSLDKLELVIALEDEFEMEIPDEDAEQIETIQHAVDFVTSRAETRS